jgi:hypothetical protein
MMTKSPTGSIELRSWNWSTKAPVVVDTEVAVTGTVVRVTRLTSTRVLTSHLTSAGLVLKTWSLSAPAHLRDEIAYVRTNLNVPYWMRGWGNAGLPGTETAVTGVRGSGAASVYRGLDAQDHLAVSDFPWEHPIHTTSSASDELQRKYRRVAHTPATAGVLAEHVEICSVSAGNSSAAAQVTAFRDPGSQLTLRLWREGAN